MRILLLEDDFTLSKEIKNFFIRKEINCDTVFDGSLFFSQFKLEKYDVCILDINVPNKNGFEICQEIRAMNKNMPILMLTAFGEVEDKLKAFQDGADDYLVKPFHLEELLARVTALYRRKETPQAIEELIEMADLEINLSQCIVKRSGNEIELSPKEYKLLVLLAKAKGRVVSKQFIADQIWDYNVETNQNTIEVYINFLRKKIDKDYEPKLIKTRPGFGYYLKIEN